MEPYRLIRTTLSTNTHEKRMAKCCRFQGAVNSNSATVPSSITAEGPHIVISIVVTGIRSIKPLWLTQLTVCCTLTQQQYGHRFLLL